MSKICSNCGNVVEDSCMVCNRCGAPAEQTGIQQPIYQPVQEEKTPSVGMWVGLILLSSIPVVGLIVLIIAACGGLMNSTAVKKWAQAMLIMMVVGVALYIILLIIFFIGGAALFSGLAGLYDIALLV